MAKRGRKRGSTGKRGISIVAEQAALYGLRVPAKRALSEQFISPNEAGRILNVTGEAVKQWVYHRRLPATKLSNGYWKIKVADLEQFVKSRQDHTQKKILIIDGSGQGLNDMIEAVEKLGHVAVVAHNSADALLKASDLYPSLFIVNVSMPQTDSWKLLEKFRETRNIKTLPILIVSDHDLKESESDRAVAIGVQGFLRRPIKTQIACDEIEKVLGRIL